MALLDELADFIANLSFDNLTTETVEQTKLHLFDSLGAMHTGARTDEGRANCDLVEKMVSTTEINDIPVIGFGFTAPLPYAVLITCVATRLTETDDIDLSSCTTPGSVVIPAALSVAFYAGASGKELFEGVVAGYDVITRLGAAVNGPEILYRGIWPTYLCGAIGAATVAAKILGLTLEQTKNALAISLTLSAGLSGKMRTGLTSRWLTLGCAAQNGLIAALAGARGFAGDSAILDTGYSSVYGMDLNAGVLLDGLGEKFGIEKVSLKPFCSARQAISSIEAFQWLLKSHEFDPEVIEDVHVIVPPQYSQMIDRKEFPENRLASIVSVQYQLAMAAFYGEDLFDIERRVLRDEGKVHRLMKKIHVKTSSELTAIYPQKWPGKISLKVAGRIYEHEVLAPSGAPDQPMSWEEVEEKIKRLTRGLFEPAKVEELGAGIKDLNVTTPVRDFVNAFARLSS